MKPAMKPRLPGCRMGFPLYLGWRSGSEGVLSGTLNATAALEALSVSPGAPHPTPQHWDSDHYSCCRFWRMFTTVQDPRWQNLALVLPQCHLVPCLPLIPHPSTPVCSDLHSSSVLCVSLVFLWIHPSLPLLESLLFLPSSLT